MTGPLGGIACKIASVTCFVIMAAIIKATASVVPAGQAVFFRSLFAIPVILVWLTARGELRRGLATAHPLGHAWRGIAGTTSMILIFAALGLLPLPEATALGYATPLLLVIFAAMFLRERVRVFRLLAVLVGLAGVLIVLSPRMTLGVEGATSAETLGAVLALGGATFAALAQVYVRKLVRSEETAAIVFYFSVTGACVGLLTLPFGWVLPTPGQTVLLIAAGLIGGVGQILLTESYRYAEASLIAPFEYTSMLLAILIGYFVFSEIPTRTTIVGATLIVAAGLFIIWRERQLGLARARARQAMTPQG